MRLRSRLDRLVKSLGTPGGGPLTVLLREAGPGLPPGRRERTNSAGLPVLEIVYDPASGPVELPPPPYKLVHGVDPAELV
jgi:hypothetical protein